MAHAHEPCVETTGGCRRCEAVPAAVSSGGEYLLLAPMDALGNAALAKILKGASIEFERRGSVMLLSTAGHHAGCLVSLLNDQLSASLKERIKGVFVHSAETPDSIVEAVIRAEALPTLFDILEVEWAREALRRGDLFSVFHPIVDSSTGSIFAYEALIRANRPETGEIVGAGQLIYACQRLNLLHQFDQAARISAIRSGAALNQPDCRIFINFLASTIYDPDVCLQTTVAAAQEVGLGMDRLVFEVTETEHIPSMQHLRQILDYYRRHGAGVALDDISSGFSSLQYLADLLPDYVKIDRDLVTSAASSLSARHTLESIVSLAQKLNVKVIAEGVETVDQMQICVDAGVEFLQGYLFALPGNPPEAIPAGLFPSRRHAA
jgi:EAL domain-containing protein (putative c-di-GMP-specific phosphodiesterase class I)